MKQHYRHGDISLHPTKEVRGNKITHKGSFVLAEGETTGHKHVITTERPQDLEIYQSTDGSYYFSLRSKGTITHEEHNTIEVLPGIYKMHNEREYDWFSMATKKVVD